MTDKKQNLHDKLGAKKDAEVEDDFEEEIDEVEQELDEADSELKEAQERLLRAHAEMENIRRRAERDVAGAHKYALEKFVKDLIPVVDSLEQALKHASDQDDAKAIHEGVEMTMTMFLGVLKRFGVEQLDPVNDRFNPEFHEAMTMVPHPDADPETIIEVFQKGYLLNGRLVRPARVVVVQG